MADNEHSYAQYSKLDQPGRAPARASVRDVDESPQRRQPSRDPLDRISDGWFWEAACLLLGFGSFAGTCVVFAIFDDRTLPNWPLGITLNALISFLSTISKGLLLVTITQSLAQVKWIHYSRRERPLYDLQLLDGASRGVLGSFTAVSRGRGGAISIIGGIIFLLTILLDPFTQQVLTYPTREVRKTNEAAISKALSFLSNSEPSSFQNTLWAAMYSGVMAPNTTFIPHTLSCPTGNCEWPEYNQLGVCAETQDVTSLVSIDCTLTQPEDDDRYQIYSTPAVYNGAPWCSVTAPGRQTPDYASDLNSTIAFPTVFFTRDDVEIMSVVSGTSPKVYVPMPSKRDIASSVDSGSSPGGFQTAYQPITSINTETYFASLYTVYKSSSSLISPTNFTGFFMATQTIFSLCSQTLKVKVNQGIPEVTTLNAFTPAENFNTQINNSEYFQFTVPGSSEVSLVDRVSLFNLGNYASRTLNSSVAATVLYNDVIRNPDYEPPLSTDDLPPDVPDARTWMPAHLEKIRFVGDGLAASLTRNIQSLANTTVLGDAFQSETYVHVRWEWLALHGALMLLTLLLFICTVLATSATKVGIWKSSVWPAFFLLDKGMKEDLGEMSESTPSSINNRAKGLKVKLR